MFNWFLKLLGIEDDRPIASTSLLKSNEQSSAREKETTVSEPQLEAEQQPTPESKTIKVEASSPETLDSTVEAIISSPEPEPAVTSLENDYQELKANYIKILNEAGFSSKAAIDKASDKELLALKGIGKATLTLLRK